VFRSTPGLFVEDDEQHIPDDFLQPVSQQSCAGTNSSVVSEQESNGQTLLSERVIKMESDAEELISKDANFNACKTEINTNGPAVNGENVNVEKLMSVHEQIAARNTVRWSLFVSQNDIDKLIDSLNPRGLRESKLRQVISEQRDLISELVAKCDKAAFCAVDTKPLVMSDNIPVESSAERTLEENLRDALLDIEERIFSGTLGSLKV
jgi:Williams-Beuren syndrome DDT (WSD), D-TOX E motif